METTTERRLDSKVRWLKAGAMIGALFAAAGIGLGLYEGNPACVWLVPVAAGLVAAAIFAAFWHWAVGAITDVDHPWRIIVAMLLSLFVAGIAFWSSTFGIAQAVSGHGALVREMEARIQGYNDALQDAYVKATAWNTLTDTASTVASGYAGEAKNEADGGHGTGKGCGPRCTQLHEFAANYQAGFEALTELFASAKTMRTKGEAALDDLQAAAAKGDPEAFMRAGNAVNRAIMDMNGIDPRPVVNLMGVIHVQGNADAGKLQIEEDEPTKQFHALAEKLMQDRQVSKPVTFTPISLGEATRAQMFGSALQGWILGMAIDLMPFVFLIAAFLSSREPSMHQLVKRRRRRAWWGHGAPANDEGSELPPPPAAPKPEDKSGEGYQRRAAE